jgi:hypothetical protein
MGKNYLVIFFDTSLCSGAVSLRFFPYVQGCPPNERIYRVC